MIITKYVWAFDDGSFFVMPKSSWKVDAKVNNKTTKINEATMYSEPMDVPPYAGLSGKWVKVNISYSVVPTLTDIMNEIYKAIDGKTKLSIDVSKYPRELVDRAIRELVLEDYSVFEWEPNELTIYADWEEENDDDATS